MDPKDQVPADELELETESKQEKKEEDVRASVIADFGFDEVDDEAKIEKLTKERMGNHSKLSTAIGQKIKYRDAAKKPADPVKPVEPPKPESKTIGAEDVAKTVAETFEQRDLEEMDLPDAIKNEIKRIAAIQGVSVKQAARDPYIVTKIEDHKKAQKTDDAALGRNNKGAGSGSKKDWSVDSPPDIDVSTPEGRKDWDAYIAWAIKQTS